MNKHIQAYIDIVRHGEYPVCTEQLQICELVEKVLAEEGTYLDEEQLERYLANEKYFPYALFPWERFCFALHNCLYRADGQLRFPVLVIVVGRGSGKNGFLSFENFNLLTPVNGIPEYNIDIFATSEDQAKASWEDVYNILESKPKFWKKYFSWNKEEIRNLKTNSVFRYRTSNADTKDGGRQGKVDFDEYHAYKDYKLINVAVTGLGKKRLPRRTIISTNGEVREGPFDDLMEICRQILEGEIDDGGMLPFICRIEDEKQIHDKLCWHMANPSLRYFPHLMYEMEMEYQQYRQNPIANSSFATKRMNFRPKHIEGEVTSWDNIEATNRPIDESRLVGLNCTAGIDYAKTTDFISAALEFEVDDELIYLKHTWVCRRSPDLPRIKAPLESWEAAGLLTFVDALEIPPDLPVFWLAQTAARLNARITVLGIDNYRYTLLRKSILEYLYMSDEKGYENVMLIRPSDQMQMIPSITSDFNNHRMVWGDDPLTRWAAWNAKLITSKNGNTTYGKIEPKSRKTDPFMAIVACKCGKNKAIRAGKMIDGGLPTAVETKVYTY